MSLEYIAQELSRLGVSVKDDSISFKQESTSNVSIPFPQIKSIKIVKSQTSISTKILYWILRILTWDSMTGKSWFSSRLSYQNNYDLQFETLDNKTHSKVIKDFDLFKLSSIVNELNKVITEHPHG